MKKKIVSVLTATLFLFLVTTLNTGCFGKFALTQKVYNFNKGLGSKFVQELGFILMLFIPVYGVASLIDAFILNTIEFWTGSNPMAMNDGDVKQQYVMLDGKVIKMTATKGKMTIVEDFTSNPSVNVEMVYNFDNNTWDVYSNNELSHSVRLLSDKGDVELVQNNEVVSTFNLYNYDYQNLALAR